MLIDAATLDVHLIALPLQFTFGFLQQQCEMAPLTLQCFILLADLSEIDSAAGQLFLSLLPLVGQMLGRILGFGDGDIESFAFESSVSIWAARTVASWACPVNGLQVRRVRRPGSALRG